jgi:hypothetical protein
VPPLLAPTSHNSLQALQGALAAARPRLQAEPAWPQLLACVMRDLSWAAASINKQQAVPAGAMAVARPHNKHQGS